MHGCAFLPEEITLDILLRLPAKSIGRCRCVCKSWRTLLSQHGFIKTHLNRTKQLQHEQLVSFIFKDFQFARTITLMSSVHGHHLFDEITFFAKEARFSDHDDCMYSALCSYDGLILVTNIDIEHKMFLVNPTTREIKELPRSPLFLDPRHSYDMYGLGYDSVSDDYKIVRLSYFYEYNVYDPNWCKMFVDVFSVRHGTWKMAERSPYFNNRTNENNNNTYSGVLLNGCLHWLVCNRDYKPLIAAFDLAEEKFFEVPAPRLLDSDILQFSHIHRFGACLCLFSPTDINEIDDFGIPITTGTDVWVMEEYGVEKSWTKFTIFHRKGEMYEPLYLLGQRQLVLLKTGYTKGEQLVMYDSKAGTLEDIEVHGIDDCNFVYQTFMESLVSPHCCS